MSAVSGSLLQTSTGTQGILNVPCTLAGVVEQCFSTARPRPGTGVLASIIPGSERFSWNLSF